MDMRVVGVRGCVVWSIEFIKSHVNKCQLESQSNSLERMQRPLQISGLC